jgi:protein SCO1
MTPARSLAIALLMTLAAALSACDEAASTPAPAPGRSTGTATGTAARPGQTGDAPKPDAANEAKPANVAAGVAADNDPAVLAWAAPKDRYNLGLGDFHVTDQDGKAMTMADLEGRPFALSWVFTRCANPQMCPLIAATMGQLQKKADEAGLADKTRFVLVSYDPTYDTPDRLKKFGSDHGLTFTNAAMLRPNVDELGLLIQSFQLTIGPAAGNQINHKSELFIFDHHGKLARSYSGRWQPDMALADLKRLVEEQEAAAKQEQGKK